MADNEISMITNNLAEKLSPKKIYLFGSFATGTANDGSDIDIYIIMNDGTDNLKDLTTEAYRSIRNVRSRAVDIVIGTESQFEGNKNRLSLENEVIKNGVLVYDRMLFLLR